MWFPPLFSKLVARRADVEQSIRFGDCPSGPPMRVGSLLPEAVDPIASQPALAGMFVRTREAMEPWGVFGEPLTAWGLQLKDESGHYLV